MSNLRSKISLVKESLDRVSSHSATLVLLLGLGLSGLTSWLALHTIQRDEQRRFEMARQEVEYLVRARFERYVGVLQHTRAFITSKERVSRQDFRLFLASVDITEAYPDLQAVAFAEKVSLGHKAAHEREVREDGYPKYKVWPRAVIRLGALYPAKFLEPFAGANQKALGFDLQSEKQQAATMKRARDTAQPALTPAVSLIEDDDRPPSPGFLLLLPVYQRGVPTDTVKQRRRAIEGFVYAPFRAVDLLLELYRSAVIFRNGIGVRVTAGGQTLFTTSTPIPIGPLHALNPVNIFGQTWYLETFTTPEFASPADRYAPIYLFVTGLMITLLAAWVVNMAEQHARSQREAIEMRDEFLSICSHELRTPLTSMKLQNQLVQRTLRDDLAKGNTARFEKMVSQSGRQIERLVRLVEEMLDISRVRCGKLSLTPEDIDLRQLMHETLERFAAQLSAAGCSVHLNAPEALSGHWDRMRLEQIATNLLSNAMKYGAGKPVLVEILRRGNTAVLAVEDRGIGIAPEHQARIFERFERAVSQSEIGGLGLGLYIVKQILELFGGNIRVSSTPGAGSRFEVELPLEQETVHLPRASLASVSASEPSVATAKIP